MKKLGCYIALGLSVSACASINGGTSADNGNQNGSNNSNIMVTQYPIEKAMLNIYTKARSQALVAVVDNQNIVAEITVTPKGSMIFNNQQVQGTEINTITKSNNQIINQSVSINYFTLNPLNFKGFTDSSGEYSIATQTTTIPKMAKVGDSSALITENVYSDSSKRQKIGLYTQSWALTPDSKNTAWFCIHNSVNALLAFDPKGTVAECYKINAKGDILNSKLTMTAPADYGTNTITFIGR